MIRITSRLSLFVFAWLVAAPFAFGQLSDDPYRRFFKQPETPAEYWAAVKFEIELGKYDLAYVHLKGLLEKLPEGEEGDKFLLDIEQKEGIAAFLKLLTIPDLYEITEAQIGMWNMKKLLPEKVIEKLDPLKKRPFVGKQRFDFELSKVLDPLDYKRYRGMIEQETRESMRVLAAPLLERVSAVVKKFRTDPVRIKKFIDNLGKTPEERAYAVTELSKSGQYAVPYLMEALEKNKDNTFELGSILYAMRRLNREVVPPLLAALDIRDEVVRANLVDVLRLRRDERVVPYLWYLASSPKQPPLVRKQAKKALSDLLNEDPNYLPNAARMLTKEARRYYNHEVKLPEKVEVWEWDGEKSALKNPPTMMTPSQAEEYHGLRFARQALDLEPTNLPAQIVFLSLALDKAYERVGVDQPLDKLPPSIRNLLRTVNYELLMATLDQALTEHRLPVILAATRALGDLVDVRAVKPPDTKTPILMKALNYPDRRVQLAAATAILKVPGGPFPAAGARLVEVLRRTASIGSAPKVLIGDQDRDRAEQVAQGVKEAGYEPVIARTGRELVKRFREAGDIDAIIIDENLNNPLLPYTLGQLRADMDAGLVPIFLTAAPGGDGKIPLDRERRLRLLASPYKNIWVEPLTVDPNQLKQRLSSRIVAAAGRPIVGEERQAMQSLAMFWLKRLATEEEAGYDVLPAQGAILANLRNPVLAPLAMEAAASLPGRLPQRELAGLVLDPNAPAEARAYAATQLVRNIQKFGILITAAQTKGMLELFQKTDDARLKSNVALVLGGLRPSGTKTGTLLKGYLPPDPGAKKPEEKPKPKENEKQP